MSSSAQKERKEINSSANDTDASFDQKVEMAQKFDKEMKDYAKATVKEFLGIYGYEEDVDNISMEESCTETPRSSVIPSVNNPISASSETLASSTQSISSDFGTTEDTKERMPADVISYQSSGPLVFAVVPADSQENTDTSSVEAIVTGTPKSRADQFKSLRAHCYQLQQSAITESENQITTLKPLPPMPVNKYGLSEAVDERSESVVTTSESDGTLSEPAGNLVIVSGRSENVVGTSDDDGITSGAVGATSKIVKTSSGLVEIVSRVDETSYGYVETPMQDSLSQMDRHLMDAESGCSFEEGSGLVRNEKNRLLTQRSRFNESIEKREERLARQRERARSRRANEGETERGARLIKDRNRQRVKRTQEAEGERERRLTKQRLSARNRRQAESPEQKQNRLLRDKERTRRNRAAKRSQVTMVVTSQG